MKDFEDGIVDYNTKIKYVLKSISIEQSVIILFDVIENDIVIGEKEIITSVLVIPNRNNIAEAYRLLIIELGLLEQLVKDDGEIVIVEETMFIEEEN
jgi:hypothetical protein